MTVLDLLLGRPLASDAALEFILFASGSLAMPYTLLLRTKLRPAGT